jgi:predicted metal-binding protein
MNEQQLSEARDAFSKLRDALDGLMPIAQRLEEGELAEMAKECVHGLAVALVHEEKISYALDSVRFKIGSLAIELEIRSMAAESV